MANEDDNYNEDNSSEWDLDTHLKKRGIPFKSINSEEPEGQFELGRMYYDVQDYEQAFYWYKKAAENGHIEAQLNLGLLYYNGKGVDQSYEEAVKWWSLAAEQGDASAQFNLGICYKNGEGVEQDYEEAVKWYRLAAEQGNAAAQDSLGGCYYWGEGVEQDYEEAVKWYRLAAEQGNAEALFDLAVMYYKGEGVDKDEIKAEQYFEKAADSEYREELLLDIFLFYDNEDDYEKALKWCPRKDDNVEFTPCDIGCMYEDDYFSDDADNYEKAVKWFLYGAEQGDAASQSKLGEMYYNGLGVEQDYEEAFKWHKLAAEHGEDESYSVLGSMYCLGIGTVKDYKKALDCFKKYYEREDLIIENDVLYSSDKSIIYEYNGSDIDFYKIPDSVKKICSGAFGDCVESVSIPKDCEIEKHAFGDDVEIIRRK